MLAELRLSDCGVEQTYPTLASFELTAAGNLAGESLHCVYSCCEPLLSRA